MFDADRFLRENFTNAPKLVAFVGAFGVDAPKLLTAEKWFLRRSVPSDWLPVLLALLELDRGGPVSIVPYLVERE